MYPGALHEAELRKTPRSAGTRRLSSASPPRKRCQLRGTPLSWRGPRVARRIAAPRRNLSAREFEPSALVLNEPSFYHFRALDPRVSAIFSATMATNFHWGFRKLGTDYRALMDAGERLDVDDLVGTTPADLRRPAVWLVAHEVEEVVMESTAQRWRPSRLHRAAGHDRKRFSTLAHP
jgi:hypothetical protein